MSTLEVNAIKSRTGTNITIDSTAAITGTASQFKITGGTAGQALITDGAGNITFGAVDALPSQSTHAGKFLKTDGTDASWDTIDEFSVTIADTPPGSASTGALWWESDSGRLKIYYDDGTSSQWVDANPTSVSSDLTMGGDLSGVASNAQIAANKVGITELNVADGTSGQALKTDGSGTLSFGDVSVDVYDTATASTGYFDLPAGTTAQRPGTPTSGNFRHNTTDDVLEWYTGSTFGWRQFAGANPTITGINPTTSIAAGTSITVTGINFQSGSIVKLIGNDSTVYTAASTSFVDSTEVTFTTPELPVANEPYDVKLILPAGGFFILANALDAGGVPAWTTAAGSLGTISHAATGTHFTLAATDPDGGAITYAETTSVLTTAGLTLNGTTGAITGDPTDVTSSTVYSFDVTATDPGNNVTSRSFSITVENQFSGASGGTTATYSISGVNYKSHTFTGSNGSFIAGPIGGSCDILVVAGGGGGGYDNGGGGGAGGMIEATSISLPTGTHSMVIGSGGSNEGGGTGYQGNSSTFTLAGAGSALYTAIGGGGGGCAEGNCSGGAASTLSRKHGGSAGGCGQNEHNVTGNATAGQGNVGGICTTSDMGGSGGGGAGQAGVDNPGTGPSDGGDGKQNNYRDGNATWYAGGGGGGECQASNCGFGDGGQGGGGHGCGAGQNPVAGSANTGGGGGGGGQSNPTHEGAGGGSGIVVIRYIVS